MSLQPPFLAALIASRISISEPIPVDISNGFFFEAAYLINSKSVNSNEAILYAGVFKESSKSIAFSSKGVENSVMPLCLAN